jgi:hypothetical protein
MSSSLDCRSELKLCDVVPRGILAVVRLWLVVCAEGCISDTRTFHQRVFDVGVRQVSCVSGTEAAGMHVDGRSNGLGERLTQHQE